MMTNKTAMTPAEFCAWLDGFASAVGDAPTPDQWQKVLGKAEDMRRRADGPVYRGGDVWFGEGKDTGYRVRDLKPSDYAPGVYIKACADGH